MQARPISLPIVALATLLASPLARAQESPDVLTSSEWRCQKETARSSSRASSRATECLVECERASETDPLRFCGPFGFDAETQLCLSRAEVKPRIRMLRSCAAERCPECYNRADCESFGDVEIIRAREGAALRVQPILCDDTASPDGLNAGEAKCRESAIDQTNRLKDQLRRCFTDCNKRRHVGKTTEEACDPKALDTPDADEKLQACVFRARIRFLRSCVKCEDEPECWASQFPPLGCSQLLENVESQAAFDEDRHFCVDRAVCGDGFVSGEEECDFGIFPSGCDPSTAFCNDDCSCVDFPVCGDGQITAFESCDPSATPTGCDETEQCIDCFFCEADPCAVITPVGPAGGTFQGETSSSGSSGIFGSCGGFGPEDTFSWTPDRDGIARIDTCGSSFDTVLHVRAGACGFGAPEVACNRNADCGTGSRVELGVKAGTTYFIYVDGAFFGQNGAYRLRVVPPRGAYGSAAQAFVDPRPSLLE